MRQLSRALRRWDPVRVGSVGLGLAAVVMLASFGLAIATSPASVGSIVAAAAVVAIAGAGLLYAWRLGAGGLAE